MALRVGRYRLGFAPVSMIVLFIVLSVSAVIISIRQSDPEWSMPLGYLLVINEGFALLATLVYGILVHLFQVICGKLKKR